MQEQTFLSESNITVTTTRFIVSGQTYAMNGVTAVKSLMTRATKGPVVLMILGALALYMVVSEGQWNMLFGALLFAGAGFAWWKLSAKYIVMLSTASGEVEALSSHDSGLIRRVVEAVNAAIVSRG